MKYFLVKIILFFGFLLCISCSGTIVQPFLEIPDPSLSEIAMVRVQPKNIRAVIYNPDTCEQIGAACGFFRLHAYAHGHLNHQILVSPASYPASLETEADCWTAKYGKANETLAIVKLFLEEDVNTKWKIHGDPKQRAETIRSCAIEAGRWLSSNLGYDPE